MNLEYELSEYLQITKKIIDSVNREEYESLNGLIDDRQKIIDKLKSVEFERQKFVGIAEALSLKKYEDEMLSLINNKQMDLKHKMENVKNQKKMNDSYNKLYSNPLIFSKKI